MKLSNIVYDHLTDLNVEFISKMTFDAECWNLIVNFKYSTYHFIEVHDDWCSLWLCLPKGWYYDSTVQEHHYGLSDLDISKIKKAECGDEYHDRAYCCRWKTFNSRYSDYSEEELKITINELVDFTRKALNLISFKTQLESEKDLTGNL